MYPSGGREYPSGGNIHPSGGKGNAHPVASVQVLIDRTLDELCNVMETHLSEFTLAFINC